MSPGNDRRGTQRAARSPSLCPKYVASAGRASRRGPRQARLFYTRRAALPGLAAGCGVINHAALTVRSVLLHAPGGAAGGAPHAVLGREGAPRGSPPPTPPLGPVLSAEPRGHLRLQHGPCPAADGRRPCPWSRSRRQRQVGRETGPRLQGEGRVRRQLTAAGLPRPQPPRNPERVRPVQPRRHGGARLSVCTCRGVTPVSPPVSSSCITGRGRGRVCPAALAPSGPRRPSCMCSVSCSQPRRRPPLPSGA